MIIAVRGKWPKSSIIILITETIKSGNNSNLTCNNITKTTINN